MTEVSPQGLVAALARAQAEFPAIAKAHTNPHYKSKYADLSDLLAAVRPVLAAHGVFLSQPLDTDDEGRVRLYTVLEGHGEVRKACLPLNIENMQPQQLLSTLTYYRRGMLASMLGVAAEDDDDGNAAQTVAAPAESVEQTDHRRDLRRNIKDLTESGQEAVKAYMRLHEIPALTKPGATAEQLMALDDYIDTLLTEEPFDTSTPHREEGRVMTPVQVGDADSTTATEPTAKVSDPRPGEPASRNDKPFEPVVWDAEKGEQVPVAANPARAAREHLSGSERQARNSVARSERSGTNP